MSLTQWKDFDDLYDDVWWRKYRYLTPSWRNRYSLWRDDFSLGLRSRDFFMDFPKFRELEYQARELERKLQYQWREVIPITSREDLYLSMDLRDYKPHEITVKTTDSCVTIEAKHEEYRSGHWHVTRQVKRSYLLPWGFDPNTMTSELSSDGLLSIKAPAPKSSDQVVNIHRTYGPSRVSFKSIEDKKSRF